MDESQIQDVKPGEFPLYVNDPSKTPKPVEESKKMIDISLIPQGSGSRLDSDKVDGINAYVQPTPNCLVPLDEDGHFILEVNPAMAYYAFATFRGF